MVTKMISAAEARKIACNNVGSIVNSFMQKAESEIKRKSLSGQTTCYMELKGASWEVHTKLKELLTAEGYKVEIGGRQGDTPHLSIAW